MQQLPMAKGQMRSKHSISFCLFRKEFRCLCNVKVEQIRQTKTHRLTRTQLIAKVEQLTTQLNEKYEILRQIHYATSITSSANMRNCCPTVLSHFGAPLQAPFWGHISIGSGI